MPASSDEKTFFFTYRLFRKGRIKRIGKGCAFECSKEKVKTYLQKRYAGWRWDRFECQWHWSESAAFKAEAAKIDTYIERKGKLPPYNARRGGGGGRVGKRCCAICLNGTHCQNDVERGRRLYCGVHGNEKVNVPVEF